MRHYIKTVASRKSFDFKDNIYKKRKGYILKYYQKLYRLPKLFKKKYFLHKSIDEIMQSYYIINEGRNKILYKKGEVIYDLHGNI